MRSKMIDGGSDRSSERGVALIVVLLIMMLMSALMIGFSTIVSSDQKFRGIDKDRTRAYYGATSGLEKLTADLGNLFLTNVAPTAAQIANLSNLKPSIPSVTFTTTNGMPAYGASLQPCNAAGALVCSGAVTAGPYQGLIALKQLYRMDVVAKTTTSGEVHLTRNLETVAIPVFQFGMFSDVDLSFFAGPDFNFGGRVHTNGNLFLAEGDGKTLTLSQKVTAVKEVVRAQLSNGLAITDTTNNSGSHNGTISMANGNNSFRNLLSTEGSVTGGLSPKTTNTSWPTISLSTYNGYIRNGATGAKPLNLALVGLNMTNNEMARRPPVNENVTNPVVFGERMFGKVSLRILLSDTVADITSLPTVTPTPPIRLGDDGGPGAGLTGDWGAGIGLPAGYGPVDATHPPIARVNKQWTFATSGATAAGATSVPTNGVSGVAAANSIYNFPNYNATGPVPITMQFEFKTSAGGHNQYVNCKDVSATGNQAAPTITFSNCNRADGATLSAVAATDTLTITNSNGTLSQPFTGFATTNCSSGHCDYVAPSTAARDSIVTNTFWLPGTDGSWNLVTCVGFSTATNTANAGPFAMTSLSSCNGLTAATAAASTATNAPLAQQFTGTIGGYLKIEMQDTTGAWRDVTLEILNWGFGDRNQTGAGCGAGANGDPTPNAIIRLQRLRDHSNPTWCTYNTANGNFSSFDYWPNTIYDTREGLLRDVAPATPTPNLGGVIHYVAIDIGNLSKWFAGTAPYAAGSGTQAYTNNGYAVYFSDRRNNRTDATVATGANAETGEYGFEDFVNPNNANGAPNGVLDTGEDVNGDGVLQTYGQKPSFLGVSGNVPPGATAPLAAGSLPTTPVGRAYAETNRAILFRRALKLQNGGAGNIVLPGLSVITENPVYIQGDWNASNAAGGWTNNPSATSVIADAVTLLSSQWTDANGWANPYDPSKRARTTPAWYRLAIIGGKGPAFPYVPGPNNSNDFGTDGGAHNFLRYLESGQTVNYQGAIATFYYNRQAVGTFKCCNTVYSAPGRNYLFDINFLSPALLPPLTPVFRDINITGFSQETRPGR
jgi:Tfp pilus assembly protein PilX